VNQRQTSQRLNITRLNLEHAGPVLHRLRLFLPMRTGIAMKRLLLLRHAKSSWKEPALSDYERPLNKRGRSAAILMAEYMAREHLRPEVVLCSSARRTCETLAYLSPVIGAECDIKIERALYLVSADQLLARISEVDSNVRTILLIGHNPALAEVARQLGGKGDAEAKQQMRSRFPTAALAVIDSNAKQWRDLQSAKTLLERFATPKDLLLNGFGIAVDASRSA